MTNATLSGNTLQQHLRNAEAETLQQRAERKRGQDAVNVFQQAAVSLAYLQSTAASRLLQAEVDQVLHCTGQIQACPGASATSNFTS